MVKETYALRTWEITCELEDGLKRETYVVSCNSDRPATQLAINAFRAETGVDANTPVLVKVRTW